MGGPKSSIQGGHLEIGVNTLPSLPKDSTDRNRTSPFAFTGNKFEFRMVPSSLSISGPNVVLNLIVAETLSLIADRLEKVNDFHGELRVLLKEIATNHSRILYDGNGYSDEWVEEAERRGLPHFRSTVEAVPTLLLEKNIKIYEKHGVLDRTELHSRYEIYLEQYSKSINIEALTMLDMAQRQIMPASIKYVTSLAKSINTVKMAYAEAEVSAQEELLKETSSLLAALKQQINNLQGVTAHAKDITDAYEQAVYYRDSVFTTMGELRQVADQLEEVVDANLWPFPAYSEMLFKL